MGKRVSKLRQSKIKDWAKRQNEKTPGLIVVNNVQYPVFKKIIDKINL